MTSHDPHPVPHPTAESLIRNTLERKEHESGADAAEIPADGQRDGPVLGRDPFDVVHDFDPFTEGLAALGFDAPSASRDEISSEEEPEEPTPLRRRRWTSAPPLAEIEAPDPSGLIER